MRPFLRTITSLLLFAPLLPMHAQQTAKLAATPPMGWNSWNWFAGKVTDKDVRQAADLLVSSGMRDAGYVYVNIDDTWEGKRDSTGVLHTNEKFPDMKALADYVHSKGLKLGIYSSPGSQTCARFEGSFGHEQQDADLYASWGIDYLKYDLCSFHNGNMRVTAPGDSAEAMTIQYKMMHDAYARMHQALLKTGRPIVYSLCQYGFDSVWQWGPEVGANLWRTTDDVNATFNSIALIGRDQAGLSRYAGPGHWNDPDMLEVGNGKLTLDENRTHMGLWSMLAAPLLAGNNLSELTPEITAILTNREILAIDQDKLGHQADRIYAEGPIEIWARPLADGSRALAIFNFGEQRSYLRGISLHLREAGAADGWHARDIWAAKDLGPITDKMPLTIPRHGSIVLRLTH
ncbi:glycoside hydrolase family 27 protein [Granulicella tundricola]|uniref:Alpha-galactosidase n=1 Tax=Granulicella tundricola (strain ATCC BAA-1859 / DSM 23138 / MP5ACTX9) TaxID=1198114 RepID=E8WYV2_GRATM|nr:glycoside hydrolase family 27 protein [Granulicella tundricola]ADW68788.1 Alpha-galactosidase [Granulicella tundricola MP5ACTX9]